MFWAKLYLDRNPAITINLAVPGAEKYGGSNLMVEVSTNRFVLRRIERKKKETTTSLKGFETTRTKRGVPKTPLHG